MNNKIEQLLAPLEAFSNTPKVRFLTWILVAGNFLGEGAYYVAKLLPPVSNWGNTLPILE